MWSLSLFAFLFTKKTNEENVFLFTNVTQYRKLAEKIDTFLKRESWKPPHSRPVPGRRLLAHRRRHQGDSGDLGSTTSVDYPTLGPGGDSA